MNRSPWRLEEVDSRNEQYPVESGLVSIACSVQALPMKTMTHSVPTQPVGSP